MIFGHFCDFCAIFGIFVVLDMTWIVPHACIAHVSCFQSRLRMSMLFMLKLSVTITLPTFHGRSQGWSIAIINEALSCKTLGTFANKPKHAETVLLNSSVVCYACICTQATATLYRSS